jgi:hypothetical protein
MLALTMPPAPHAVETAQVIQTPEIQNNFKLSFSITLIIQVVATLAHVAQVPTTRMLLLGAPSGVDGIRYVITMSWLCYLIQYLLQTQTQCKCIISHESGGNANAVNQNSGSASYKWDVGLW